MPPRVKFSREEIVAAAYELVRCEGGDALSARSLASSLGVSTAPIFTAFESIGELTAAVLARANATYEAYISEGLKHPQAFKGAGLAHIRFAKEEPRLFRFMFIDHAEGVPFSHYLPGEGNTETRVRGAVESTHGFDTEKAKHIYNHLSVYVHGLAMLHAFEQPVFDDADIDKMLSEVFWALKNYEEKEQ